MNITKLIVTVSLAMAVLTMVTSNQLSIYASPTTEDDGWVEGDYEGTESDQEEQAQDDWEDAGRPGDDDNDDNDDPSNNDLPRCELGVVQDCILNDLGQTCEVGSTEDACQDIYGGVQGSPERDQNGQLINKPNPYCDKVPDSYRGTCHDRFDTSDTTGLATCNDGTHKKDPLDCKDASGFSQDTDTDTNVKQQSTNSLKPKPYCDQIPDAFMGPGASGTICHDRTDASEDTGLYPCNDGTNKADWRDCTDASGFFQNKNELKKCGDGKVASTCAY